MERVRSARTLSHSLVRYWRHSCKLDSRCFAIRAPAYTSRASTWISRSCAHLGPDTLLEA